MLTHHSIPQLRCTGSDTAAGLRAARAMHTLWASLRGKVYCRGKRTDVILGTERPVLARTCIHRKHSEELNQNPRNWFYVLEIGDPSRNIIEKIFNATTTDTRRGSITIKQVLKLKNSSETLERFEKFREDVKNRALKHCNKNPRNTVDGNEQLLFYGINLTCCKQSEPSGFCKNSNCSICSAIQSGFYTARKKTGIWLSTSCQDIINMNVDSHVNNVKMAIMVCRAIAGRVVNMFDKSYEGDYDSIAAVKPDRVFVKNPSAVLPCFVIVLNCRYFG
ncbi:uncharacterized protein LOC112500639 isoform X2 [Cynara cardunculus var. scolymus]|uniref:uncharacterized protein LOC112500639 isoform X2 n=1 Tax=Cynara cardunculus var. scolymus TaxID=59895 RepID=UPI000D62F180|nr:uncharacterized protein LOC112500639 isoform X2 [Cynara cardunculus var. scolymus]